MADENTPAFYPRVGNIRRKDFKPAKPEPFIDDPRAMELPFEYGDVLPTRENLELDRRRGARIADLERQKSASTSPLEKLAGGLQAGRFLGSAMTQGINSIPTRLFKGDEAADKFIQDRIYKPEQPLAYEYAQDVGDFLEKLETQYKLPPILPEAVALQYLTGPATSQATRAAGKGAVKAGMELERRMEPIVKGALEQGGLPREMVMAMGANTQSNVIKPKGGNWFGTSLEDAMSGFKRGVIDEEAARRLMGDDYVNQRMSDPIDNALNKWVDSNLTNYVKKQMATPEDPVRKLAEEGIVHIPTSEVGINRYKAPVHRESYGGEQLGQSPAAKAWEDASDVAINAPTVEKIISPGFISRNPYVEKLSPDERIYGLNSPASYQQEIKGLGFDHILDVLREDLASGRIRPEQLNKVSMEQAVRRTYEYDQELAKKMNEARATSRAELPVYKDYPEGFKWVELNRPGDFAAESKAMGHSVKGYEPPQNSPDWTENSGDSGSSGYGLGGWDAIKKGKAKVYSLVDAKGEPHVTIEVGAYPDQLRAGNLKPYTQAALEEAKLLPNGYTDADVRDIEIRMAKENMPKYINQIKGKQNAKPKDEYLPFVQDFVRGGNWSDVRDFQNTNLISADQVRKAGWDMSGVTQKYFTKQEYDDFMRAEQKRVEGDGMKRGGKVSISNNPDTMMLELGNRRMKAGGVVRMAGGGDPSKRLSGNILAGASWNSLNQTLGNQLTQFNGMPTFNTSVGGATTADTYKQLMDFINDGGSFDPNAIVYLQTGGVDFLNGVPKDQIANNIDQILTILENQGVDVVLTGSPYATSMDDVVSNNFDPTMDPLFQEVASKHQNVALVGSMGDILQDKSLLSDNLHTNEQGTQRYNNDVIGALAQFTQPNPNVVNTVNTPNTVITDNATTNLDQSNTLQGGLATPAITPATTPTTQTQVLGDAVTTPVTSDTSDTSATLSTPVTSSPLSNVATAQTLTTPAVLSTPDYSKSYDALGGPDAVNDLRDQFLGMGMDEDTIGSVFSKYYSQDNPAELKEGGEVHMAGGGLSKLLRAAPKSKAEIDAIARRMAPQMLGEFVRGRTGSQSVAEKTQKQFAREKEMVHDIRPTGAERGLPRTVDFEELKDNVMVGIAGDPTISGKTIYSVNGVPLDSPSPQHGGPLYGLEHEGDAFWASGLGAANRVQNIAREASEQYDLPVIGNYVMMGPDSINYAQHYADANLAAINPAKMSRGQIEDFNNLIRHGSKKSGPRPSFPGIENPSEAYLHFSVDPELRKHFNALMQMPTVTQKYNLPSGVDIRHAVTEPDLRDLEIGVTGKSIGRLRPEIEDLGYSEHPTYSHDIPGEFLGSSKYNIPYELSFPDTLKSVRENPKQAPQEFGSFKYVGPRQVIDQQLIDEIKQYQEMIKKYTGKKKGGAVKKAEGGYLKKPAAKIDGNEFFLAAKKYGIKDSMNNLNKIVDLVNKGLSVDDAARQVADSGMHKAAGGAIRGDDLILEERPL
jgi:hypothetical protein